MPTYTDVPTEYIAQQIALAEAHGSPPQGVMISTVSDPAQIFELLDRAAEADPNRFRALIERVLGRS